MKSNFFSLSKHGYRYIAYAFVSFIVFAFLDFVLLSLFAFALSVALVLIYRDPQREINVFEKGNVLSVVDGTVIAIDEIKDAGYMYKITVDSSYKEVSVLRAPMDAKMSRVDLKRGSRLSLKDKLADKLNENVTLVFNQGDYNKVKVKHVLRQCSLPLALDINKGQELKQATQYGIMANGITEIYLPSHFRLNVSVGNKLLASQTLLGYFISIP